MCCHLLDNLLSPSSYSPAMLRLHCQSLLPPPRPGPIRVFVLSPVTVSAFSPAPGTPDSMSPVPHPGQWQCRWSPHPRDHAPMVAPPRATGQWWQGGDNVGEYIQTILAEVLCVLYCVVVVFMHGYSSRSWT